MDLTLSFKSFVNWERVDILPNLCRIFAAKVKWTATGAQQCAPAKQDLPDSQRVDVGGATTEEIVALLAIALRQLLPVRLLAFCALPTVIVFIAVKVIALAVSSLFFAFYVFGPTAWRTQLLLELDERVCGGN